MCEHHDETNAVVFHSKFTMTKDHYIDFCSISFHILTNYFLLLFVLSLASIIGSCLLDQVNLAGYSTFMTVAMYAMFFRVKRNIHINHERRIVSNGGKDDEMQWELSENTIDLLIDKQHREYNYEQISKFMKRNIFSCFI